MMVDTPMTGKVSPNLCLAGLHLWAPVCVFRSWFRMLSPSARVLCCITGTFTHVDTTQEQFASVPLTSCASIQSALLQHSTEKACSSPKVKSRTGDGKLLPDD